MVKTFEELLNDIYDNGTLSISHHFKVRDLLNLMKLIRLKTIEECADKADADYNIINSNIKDEYFREEQIEVYVLKESILGLDKNSIEL